MGIVLASTIAVVLLCFLAFGFYIKRNVVRGRPSGTGSIRVTDPVLVREEPRDFFQSIMPIARPNFKPSLEEPGEAAVEMQGHVDEEFDEKEEELAEELVATSPSLAKMVRRLDRSSPTVFFTHKHLIPLAAQLTEEVWPTRKEMEAPHFKTSSYKDFSPEQVSALKPHHAALRLFTVLDASFSVSSFREEHRSFHELLYYQITEKCGNRELAKRIAMGVGKYTRNSTAIFGRKNEKIALARLNGLFWSGVLAEWPNSFTPDDTKSFHFAFSMACNFTAHYDAVLSMLEKYCGVTQARPAFALVLPREPELLCSPEDALCETPPGTYHDLLDWIEDTDAFQQLYDDTSNGNGLDACYFCGGGSGTAPEIILLNGWRVHKRCFDMLTSRLARLRTIHEARQLFNDSPNLLCAHRLINVYWPDSPPDWENRRESLFARAEGACEDCGRSDAEIEIVRVVPLEKGGSHSNDNFLCLCPTCAADLERHQKVGDEAEWQGRYRQKLEVIREAMSRERQLLFTYNETETRVISPKKWVKRRGYWLIRGYCYLHNDERLFNPRKMASLRVL